ncbi:MAG TPA: TetR/AcrR family transcriptional regulator [Leucothrix sp.]|nr:TetR/AcrR family transcriptional regulator [Leucothrix sp.]HIQ14673.1 TetR/AcrR family transcriptional regulator [Leucothrix sp.]
MPLSQEHKEQSKQKILESAFDLFTEHGFDNVSIDQIMQNVSMTRGAFYAHFSSKSSLYKESISYSTLNSPLLKTKDKSLSDKEWVKLLLAEYLSFDHVSGTSNTRCPLAFLTTDIALRDPLIRSTYSDVYTNMNKRILNYTKSYSNCDESKMLAITSMIIGGAAIGRAVDDKEQRQQILESCQQFANALLE